MNHDFNGFLREEVRRLVNAHSRNTGRSHSLVWRTLYLKLETRTGYRVPDGVTSKLRMVEAVGQLEDLLDIAKTLA